ncbi:putative MFS family arabinose efflux permease [Comamonas sp. BIGb0152]|uniref:MFS transporter n=1 Tax=Comamonas sp. BIGb0152 TaxID=2940601 RepID=UPI002168DE18|nr:MFS transporter [Comamonas sp. BIGb0152]MCS4296208.1 putative MFS family arabinose efflux permease [Comamonas sp. BIGb0152]
MPAAIYVFSLCTFAFGLSEFVVAGLLSAMAANLHVRIAAVGAAIAVYALGAAIGAPFVTAFVSHWRDKHVLMVSVAVLTSGSILMSLSPNLPTLLAVRFVVGLGHGVFMAVASDAATKLVDKQHAGRALSVVWIGLTLALALGVPMGTYLGSLWSWRIIFLFIGALGTLSMFGLLFFMPHRRPDQRRGRRVSAWKGLKAVTHPQLMTTAGVSVLVSIATFSFFTFVSPYLLDVTGIDVQWLSVAMLAFGLCAIAGNLLGGYLADVMGPVGSTLTALVGLTLNLLGLYWLNGSPAAMVVLVGSLGMLFFCIVTLLTLHLLKLAQAIAPESTAVAAGLNIASFNLGTALGGGLGSITISYFDVSWVPLAGASVAAAAAAVLYLQKKCAGPCEGTV